MNASFKLGKVSIPVGETKIEIEGLEVAVSDYNVMEGLKVLKELPSILFELRQVMEMDLEEDGPLAGMVEELADKQDEDDMIGDMLKHLGAKKVNHPIFGEGVAVPKDNPLLKAFLKHEAEAELPKGLKDIMGGKTMPHPLEMILGGLGGAPKQEQANPVEEFFKGLEAKGILKKSHPLEALFGKINGELEKGKNVDKEV